MWGKNVRCGLNFNYPDKSQTRSLWVLCIAFSLYILPLIFMCFERAERAVVLWLWNWNWPDSSCRNWRREVTENIKYEWYIAKVSQQGSISMWCMLFYYAKKQSIEILGSAIRKKKIHQKSRYIICLAALDTTYIYDIHI